MQESQETNGMRGSVQFQNFDDPEAALFGRCIWGREVIDVNEMDYQPLDAVVGRSDFELPHDIICE